MKDTLFFQERKNKYLKAFDRVHAKVNKRKTHPLLEIFTRNRCGIETQLKTSNKTS
jgi:hypothetical protein